MISLGGAPRAMLEMRTSECLTSPPVGDPHSSPARAGVGEMPWWQDISARCNRPHGQDPRALDSKVGFYPDHIAKELVIGPKEPTSWHPGLQPPSCCFIVPRAPMFACALALESMHREEQTCAELCSMFHAGSCLCRGQAAADTDVAVFGHPYFIYIYVDLLKLICLI